MRRSEWMCPLMGILVVILGIWAYAADGGEELDNAKWRIQANGWVSTPSGYFNGQNREGTFNLERDFGFGNYVTFSGRVDWRFKRKHHLLLFTSPVVSSRTTNITRTIMWEGETYDLGSRVSSKVRTLILTPGYQYDFFRRRTWSLGVLANLNLIYTDASLKLAASTTGSGGSASGSREATGRFFAPLPALGPAFHWYPLPKSARFYVDGNFTGMSFFGYGNLYAASGMMGIPVGHHWDARAGYLLGSRLKVTGSSNQIGLRLTQKGPSFGILYHWGAIQTRKRE